MLEGDATLATLLDAPYTYANATVAQIYGDDIVDPAPIGASFERVALDPARRGGVLTQPSFAAVHSADDQIGFSRREGRQSFPLRIIERFHAEADSNLARFPPDPVHPRMRCYRNVLPAQVGSRRGKIPQPRQGEE